MPAAMTTRAKSLSDGVLRVSLYGRHALPAQRKAHKLCEQNKHVAYIAGIGAGKTRFGVAQVVAYCLSQQGLGKTLTGIICAISYGTLRDAVLPQLVDQLDLIKAQLPGFTWNLLTSSNRVEMAYNGQAYRIHLLHAQDADRARGINAAFIYLDEGALVSRDAYRVLRGRLRGWPSLRMWVTSTPKGKRNWLWDYCQRDAKVVHSSSFDNPFVAEELRELEVEYGTKLAAQELYGKFLETDFAAFPEPMAGDLQDINQIVIGVDWGFRNEGAAIGLGAGPAGKGFLFEIVESQKPREWWRGQFKELVEHCRRTYRVEPVFYADPEDPAEIAACKAAGLKMVTANNSRIQGWHALEAVFERGMVSPACRRLLADACTAEWAQDNQSAPIFGAWPKGYADHALDAARYAAMALMKFTGREWRLRGEGAIRKSIGERV